MPVIGKTKGPVFGGKAVVIFGAKRPPSSAAPSPSTKAGSGQASPQPDTDQPSASAKLGTSKDGSPE